MQKINKIHSFKIYFYYGRIQIDLIQDEKVKHSKVCN